MIVAKPPTALVMAATALVMAAIYEFCCTSAVLVLMQAADVQQQYPLDENISVGERRTFKRKHTGHESDADSETMQPCPATSSVDGLEPTPLAVQP